MEDGSVRPEVKEIKLMAVEKKSEEEREEVNVGSEGFPAMGSNVNAGADGQEERARPREDDAVEARCPPCDPAADPDRGVEGVRPRWTARPADPTRAEVEDHRRFGHLPYRQWCPHCVAGRSRRRGHRRGSAANQVRHHPHFAMDYGHMGSADDDDDDEEARELVEDGEAEPKDGFNFLAGYEAKYGLLFGQWVAGKGSADE